MKDKNTLIDNALVQLRSVHASDAYKQQILESLYNRAFEAGRLEEGFIDAHMGVKPDGTVCMCKYPAVVCSMCLTGISFQIHISEWERLLKVVKKDPRYIYLLMEGSDCFPATATEKALWSQDEAEKFVKDGEYRRFEKIRLFETYEKSKHE